MDVLLVCTDLFCIAGGIQRFSRNLAFALPRVRDDLNDVVVISLIDRPESGDSRYLSGVSEFVPCSGNKLRLIVSMLKMLRRQPRLVVLMHLHLAPLSMLVCLFSGSSRVLSVLYGFEVWGTISKVRLWGLKQSSLIICISEFTRKMFFQANPVDQDRVYVLHLGLDPFWTPEHSGPGLAPAILAYQPYLLTVSRLDAAHGYYKGIDCVIEALGTLASRDELGDFKFVIVGEGDDRDRLQAMAIQNGIGGRVIFTGRVPQRVLQALYAHCEFFALPSKGEGFGLVFLEAMACSKPVIAADYGAVPEIVQEGVTGLLVPHGDIPALSAALWRLMSSARTREEMGKAGGKRLEQHFAFPVFMNRLGAALAQVLDGVGAPR